MRAGLAGWGGHWLAAAVQKPSSRQSAPPRAPGFPTDRAGSHDRRRGPQPAVFQTPEAELQSAGRRPELAASRRLAGSSAAAVPRRAQAIAALGAAQAHRAPPLLRAGRPRNREAGRESIDKKHETCMTAALAGVPSTAWRWRRRQLASRTSDCSRTRYCRPRACCLQFTVPSQEQTLKSGTRRKVGVSRRDGRACAVGRLTAASPSQSPAQRPHRACTPRTTAGSVRVAPSCNPAGRCQGR